MSKQPTLEDFEMQQLSKIMIETDNMTLYYILNNVKSAYMTNELKSLRENIDTWREQTRNKLRK